MDLRRAWPIIGLVVLLVLDLVLVGWALWPTSHDGGKPTPSATATSTATPSPSASSASDTTTGTPRPLTRLLVAAGKNALWAVDTGTCAKPGTVHVSDTNGKAWKSHPTPGSVTRVVTDGTATAFIVGGTSRCEYKLWTTTAAGKTWNGPRSGSAAWGRSPKDPQVVQRPGAAPVRPCPGRAPVLDLAALDTNATALCQDGTLRRTTDGGAAWSTIASRAGGASLALSSPAKGVVAWLDATCDGVVVGALANNKLSAGTCVKGVKPAAGEVAVGISPSGVWLTAGDAVLRADAADATFAKVSGWPKD